MPSGTFNFIGDNALDQGANWKPTINWYETSPSSPFDLSLYTGVLKIKSSAKSDTVLLEASTSNGYMTLTGSDPNISINVPASITAALEYSQINNADNQLFVYDLFLTAPVGDIDKLIKGTVEVIASVSV